MSIIYLHSIELEFGRIDADRDKTFNVHEHIVLIFICL